MIMLGSGGRDESGVNVCARTWRGAMRCCGLTTTLLLGWTTPPLWVCRRPKRTAWALARAGSAERLCPLGRTADPSRRRRRSRADVRAGCPGPAPGTIAHRPSLTRCEQQRRRRAVSGVQSIKRHIEGQQWYTLLDHAATAADYKRPHANGLCPADASARSRTRNPALGLLPHTPHPRPL
jgi:hypothetical protein